MKSFFLKIFPFILFPVLFAFLSEPVESGLNPYYFSILIYAGINVTLAVSLHLVNGLTGQFSMGHAGFMSVGAYVSAYLSLNIFPLITPLFPSVSPVVLEGLFFAVSLYLSGLAAAFLGYLVGLPSLRLKGDYLAIVTLGFGEIIRVLILNINAVGGSRGLPGIPKWTTFGWVFAVASICILTIRRLMHSVHGRSFLAVREDEIAAEAMGVNTTRYKVTAFTIGSFFAGVAGALFAHFLTYINPSAFDFNRSFEIIIMVVLGGMGSTSGAVIAALFLTALREVLRPLQEITKVDLRMVIYSLMLIFLMLGRPNGFLGSKEFLDLEIVQKVLARFKKREPQNG